MVVYGSGSNSSTEKPWGWLRSAALLLKVNLGEGSGGLGFRVVHVILGKGLGSRVEHHRCAAGSRCIPRPKEAKLLWFFINSSHFMLAEVRGLKVTYTAKRQVQHKANFNFWRRNPKLFLQVGDCWGCRSSFASPGGRWGFIWSLA